MNASDFPIFKTEHIHRVSKSSIAFAQSVDGVTHISEKHVAYPHHITRCFNLPGDPPGMATLYLQSVAGGLCEGDDFGLSLTAGPNAAAHLTTTSATIVHEARKHQYAMQRTEVSSGHGSLVEYLPEPNVLMAGSKLINELKVSVGPESKCIIAESFVLHDPSESGRRFDHAIFKVDVVGSDGSLLYRENLDLNGSDSWTFDRWPNHATMLFIGFAVTGSLVQRVREVMNSVEGVYGGVSAIPRESGFAVRLASSRAPGLRSAIDGAWTAARNSLFGKDPPPRRK
jgi:urease accessory protein